MHLSKISLALRQWGAGAGFSPLSLFASGEQGAWYDPSDLSTMFQDSAGTTPVTADGQPVGLILDKSKGLVLGSELVTNGTFDSATGWTLGAGWSVAGGKLNAATNQYTRAWFLVGASAFVSGKTYKVEFDVSNYTSGVFHAFLSNGGGPKSGSVLFIGPGNGHKICYITATATATGFGFEDESGSPPSFSIDNVSVKEIAGNHATQATAAKRPLLQNDGVNNYLAFDGVDDRLETASIDFTVTDKMSAFSGSLANALGGGIFSSSAGSPNPSVIYANFSKGLRADIQNGIQSDFDAVALTKYVHSAAFDRAQSTQELQTTLRTNAVLQTPNVMVAGVVTGNFGNASIILGDWYSVLYFNGRIYSLIVLGRLATTHEITDTETWVAGKTGVTLP